MAPGWGNLIGESAIAGVVPAEYGHYRRPVRAALTRFLEGLSPSRQAAVLADQAALPLDASVVQRLARLARSCPTLHKLGQVLARDRRLCPELREQLQALESIDAEVPVAEVRATLDREVGPIERFGLTLGPRALAEASVAVVVGFQGGPVPGVFKVLKAGIEERLQEELDLLEDVGTHLDERCEEFGLPRLAYQEVFEQVASKLRQELRLDLEQRHLARARVFFAGDARVHVPALLGPCSSRVTAMERLFGKKITAHGLTSATRKRRLAGDLISALIARPVFAREEHALFHADPHAGNLLLTTDGRIGVLDWALGGSLGQWERETIVQVLLGAMTLDRPRIVKLLEVLAEWRPVDREALDGVVRNHLRAIRHGRCPGFTWSLGLLDDAVLKAQLRVSADLMLFRKSLLMLDGVIADVGGGDEQVHEVLQGEFVRQFAREWPRRLVTSPGPRAYGTRISNADLYQLMISAPFTATRFWLEEGQDLLCGVQGP